MIAALMADMAEDDLDFRASLTRIDLMGPSLADQRLKAFDGGIKQSKIEINTGLINV